MSKDGKKDKDQAQDFVRCWLCDMPIMDGAERFRLTGGKFVCKPCYRAKLPKP